MLQHLYRFCRMFRCYWKLRFGMTKSWLIKQCLFIVDYNFSIMQYTASRKPMLEVHYTCTDFWWRNVHPLCRSRYIFQGHVMSCSWLSHVWKKTPITTASISVYVVSNSIWVFMKIMTLTSPSFIENLLEKLVRAMLWVCCEERYVSEQYWRE